MNPVASSVRWPDQHGYSEDSFPRPKIAKASYICNGEGESILVLVLYRANRKAPHFKAHPTTIPVIGALESGILYGMELGIYADCAGNVKAHSVSPAVTGEQSVLAERAQKSSLVSYRV